MNLSDEEIIKGYLLHYAGDEKYFYAFEELHKLLSIDIERVWRITCKMIAQTTDKRVLSYIAAGPLEDILYAHGDAFIERVEKQTAADTNFKRALLLTDPDTGDWKPEVCERVKRIKGI